MKRFSVQHPHRCAAGRPLGRISRSYDAEMRGEGYARQTQAANPMVAESELVGQTRNPGTRTLPDSCSGRILGARARRRRLDKNVYPLCSELLEVEAAGVVAGSGCQWRHRPAITG